ncbi:MULTISPECIES: hypothetical protein [unclassified Coleofasciculus]|nr:MULTISPECIES: hypothetical protein [unclassified Coleofasciculus]MBE9128181.1 hypothetical protein [Coleofasciculus sp. LEGE 07081]MBE9149718.1 hypothetical protein [Coleofasciculus sp. LEGE 07092]
MERFGIPGKTLIGSESHTPTSRQVIENLAAMDNTFMNLIHAGVRFHQAG